MPGLKSLLPTEKALMTALQRHIEHCGKTWRHAAFVAPPQHLELRDVTSFRPGTRPAEWVLARFLRLSALYSVADMLRSARCPRPVVQDAERLAWPTDDDLDGAARNICRLQIAYRITAEDVMTTLCSPHLVNQMVPDDSLPLAVHCSLSEPTVAAAWVERSGDRRYSDFFDRHLRNLESTAKANSTAWYQVVGQPPETPSMWLYRQVFMRAVRSGFPSNTPFGELCRASQDLDARTSGNRRCWLSSGKHGAASLSPFAVEELSVSEPRLWLVHDFLSPSECAAVRQEATELEPALVRQVDGRDDQPDTRTAALTWLENAGSARRVYQHASAITGLTMEFAEKLQVLNYAVGGHFNEHTDPLSDEDEKGERLATLLVYLNDVDRGGSTAFPRADLSIRPRRGSALFWFNLKQEPAERQRQIDYSTTHGACPVLRGSKWIATLWIHERSQPWDLDYSLR
ncbi:prolyl 4-hydroxylase subunit alpha-3-like [Dermacentor silvarum]|uniref:prolyl 4-hydroxylase subunit alpha-3-like n=1 Tax=Dermacentor silvarum TaxID=543639 RepID=UPI0021014C94|nr:prolyl 4-hydroxylase subunit alpha-3-like [Dermacentor silvarum]